MGGVYPIRAWITFCVIGVATVVACEDGALAPNTSYSSVLKCGPNSLFVFMILAGRREVSLTEFEDLSISADGVSLLALRDLAKRFGIDAEIRRYRADDIGSLPLPAIGQFKNGGVSITPYHFNVIYKVDRRRVFLIDGTTGAKFSIPLQKLGHFSWTGLALTEKRSFAERATQQWGTVLLAACLFIVGLVILGFLLRSLKYRQTNDTVTKAEVLA